MWLVYGLGQLLGSFAQATVLVSAVSGSLIVFVSAALFWSSRSLLSYYLVPPALYAAGVGIVARTSSPDALAVLATAGLIYAILKERHILTGILLVALPLFRTDYIILVCAIGLLLLWNRRFQLTAISIPLALVAFFAAHHFAQNYGHLVLFNFILIGGEPHPFPASMPLSENPIDYIWAYVRGLWSLVEDNAVTLTIAGCTGALMFVASVSVAAKNRFAPFFFVALFFVISHFALFPGGFFRNYFILVWVCVLYVLDAIRLSPALTLESLRRRAGQSGH